MAALVDVCPPTDVTAAEPSNGFTVRLRNFEGPFDLLLQLISSRKMDVTEVALHQVTDEFIAYTRALGVGAGLEETTEFLVIAATLLDLKTARLLPSGEVDDVEDLALLEARDLIFARLLAYRAYRQVAQLFAELERAALRRYPRSVGLEERFAALLPEVLLGVDAAHFAEVATAAFQPAPPPPEVSVSHVHAPRISVAEQAALMLGWLQSAEPGHWTTFVELVADCAHPVQVVARFLGLLELYGEAAVVFDQEQPLGPLRVQCSEEPAAVAAGLGADYQ